MSSHTPEPLPAIASTDPAPWLTVAAAIAAIVALATMVTHDTDLWTLLAQGRAYLGGHSPTVNAWTWPVFGEPQVAASWGFRLVLWPLWELAGTGGIYLWRWAAALAAFALLWAAARRMGAGAIVTPVVLAVAAIAYRVRMEARPESLAAVLFTLALFLLVSRRTRASGFDRGWLLVPIAVLWVNVHASFVLLFALTLAFLIDDLVRKRGGAPAAPRALAVATTLAGLALLINPSGFGTILQPFEFALAWRNEPMFASIEELHPFRWTDFQSGLPFLVLAWPLLALWQALRRRFDTAEWILCAGFTALALTSYRFAGVYVLVAAVFVARDLTAFLGEALWPRLAARAPFAALARPWPRAAFGVFVIVLFVAPELARPDRPFGMHIEEASFPGAACDLMAAEDIRGNGFNHMQLGGYLAYRFWPDRGRLPFVTTQPELSPETIRRRYLEALRRPANWYELDGRYRFDWVLLERRQDPGDHLHDVLDQAPDWVMVFGDDAAELYLRRTGTMAEAAERLGYRFIPGGRDGRLQLMALAERDSAFRAAAAREATRMSEASRENGHAQQMLGYFALMDGRYDDARVHFREAAAKLPMDAGMQRALAFLAAAQDSLR